MFILTFFFFYSEGPVMRPSLRPKEERKWVLDTINQYFDVIVEEEDEEPDFDSEDEADSSDDDSLSEFEDEIEDEELEETNNIGLKSSSRMRSLLSKAAANVSNSQSNLASLAKLKQNLGSKISLGYQKSMENINNGH